MHKTEKNMTLQLRSHAKLCKEMRNVSSHATSTTVKAWHGTRAVAQIPNLFALHGIEGPWLIFINTESFFHAHQDSIWSYVVRFFCRNTIFKLNPPFSRTGQKGQQIMTSKVPRSAACIFWGTIENWKCAACSNLN